MPRLSSKESSLQLLAPPILFHASGGHVSYPNSPGCGTVWKVHASLLVRTSYARISPGADPYPWFVAEPRMSRFSNTRPGVVDCTSEIVSGSRPRPCLRSTVPLLPKDAIDFPVRASIARRKLLLA